MLDFLNRHVMHPLMARRARSRHLHYLRYLEQTQFDPPELIRARQLAALKVQLHHAFNTVPYYRAAWQAAGNRSELVPQAGAHHFSVIHGFEDSASPLCRWLARALGTAA